MTTAPLTSRMRSLASKSLAPRSSLRLVQALLLGALLVTLVWLLAWVLGPNGDNLIPSFRWPDTLQNGSNAVPFEPVHVRGEQGIATAAAANAVIGPIEGVVQPGASEFYGNDAYLSFWAMSGWQHAAWTGVRALPLAGMAVIWWLLLRLVGDIRRGEQFSRRTARRIGLIGALVLVGVPVVQVLRWRVADWLVESSNAARIADAQPLQVSWWAIVFGLFILVLAFAWRQAAAMREDLEGLV